jgi:hypothetical protein
MTAGDLVSLLASPGGVSTVVDNARDFRLMLSIYLRNVAPWRWRRSRR